MKRLLCIVLAALALQQASAQTTYEAAAIPHELMPYARSVVRQNDVTINIKDVNNVWEHHKKVITILNKSGDDDAALYLYYNKTERIKAVQGIIYNEFGQQAGKIKESDFADNSASDNAAIYEDIRVKHFKPQAAGYPYTVAYEYDLLSKQSLNLPGWFPVEDWSSAIQSSTFQVTCAPGFNIRYKQSNCPGQAEITTNADGQKVYKWQISNIKAIRNEPYSPATDNYMPNVMLAPEKFAYDGHSGSFTNWKDLGQWEYNDLLKSRSALPPETVNYIHQLTDTITNPKRKAKAIYEYMQGKTRYISIQVGIGGYQPFPAADVDRLSYGDCKALSNYTQALLKVAGVEAYYCVVYGSAAKKSLLTDFASMQGNHIILCLPFKNDTTWLECTSQKIPFGYLGRFTDDRWVLACTPTGGQLLHTPKYTAEQSRQLRTATLTLKATGELSGVIKTTFEGTQYDNRPGEASDNDKDLKMIREAYPINNMEIDKLTFSQVKDVNPVNKEYLSFSAPDYATPSSGKLYFLVNPVNRFSNVPREVRNRMTDIYINWGYTDTDEVIYELPAGYKLEQEPLDVTLIRPFGKFKASAHINANHQLVYKRTLQILDGTYSKDHYPDLITFYKAVADADHYTVSLVKDN